MISSPILLLSNQRIQAYLILLCSALLHFTDVDFNKLKGKPSICKKITTHFTAILVLLQWSGTKPAISPRYACIKVLCSLSVWTILCFCVMLTAQQRSQPDKVKQQQPKSIVPSHLFSSNNLKGQLISVIQPSLDSCKRIKLWYFIHIVHEI